MTNLTQKLNLQFVKLKGTIDDIRRIQSEYVHGMAYDRGIHDGLEMALEILGEIEETNFLGRYANSLSRPMPEYTHVVHSMENQSYTTNGDGTYNVTWSSGGVDPSTNAQYVQPMITNDSLTIDGSEPYHTTSELRGLIPSSSIIDELSDTHTRHLRAHENLLNSYLDRTTNLNRSWHINELLQPSILDQREASVVIASTPRTEEPSYLDRLTSLLRRGSNG